jgi:putative oxidoreductase
MSWLFGTDASTTRLAQRLLLAAVFLPHGAQKLLGWFGGYGFSATMRYFTEQGGLPAPIAFLVIIGESLGAVALALGFLSRVTAAGLALVMAGAVVLVHGANGFFMNWFGAQKGEGFEYHLLVLALALPIVFLGGGRASLDAAIARRLGSAAGRAGVARAPHAA